MCDCPYLDLTDTVKHPHLLDGLDPHELAAEGWFPVRYEAAGRHGSATVLVATCEEPTDELAARIERRLGSPVTLTSPRTGTSCRRCTSASARPSSNKPPSGSGAATARSPPARCSSPARRSCSPSRHSPCWRASPAPRATLTDLLAAISLAFLRSVAFKFGVCMVGVCRENHVEVSDEEVAALDPASLPAYTVLVPVFREGQHPRPTS